MIIIPGKNINLRQLKKSDAASLAENANNHEVRRFVSLPNPYDVNLANVFIKLANKNIKLGNTFPLGIEKDRKIIGIISLMNVSQKNKKADVGYWIGKKYWRQGITFEALNLIINLAFKKLKLKRLTAFVLEDNKGSISLLKKCGFVYEGKERHFAILRGRSHNALIFSLLPSDLK